MDVRVAIAGLLIALSATAAPAQSAPAQSAPAPAAAPVPFLEGTVVDEQGRPIVGASVTILDCIGTCFGGKTVLTDEQGHYAFDKKSFVNHPALQVSLPGRYEVSREETGPKLYEKDTGVPRRANFVLGTPAEAIVRVDGPPPEGWTQSLSIRSGRDAKVHRYDVPSHPASDGPSYAWFQLLPRNESLHLVITRKPPVEHSDDPRVRRERERENWRNHVQIVSPPFKLTDPQRYTVQAKIQRDAATEINFIVIESVVDAVSSNRTEELKVPDPLFGPPVTEPQREQALALLKRVQEAATPWNARPSKSIDLYEYDLVHADGESTHVRIDRDSPSGPGWTDISKQRGFAYMPPLRWLFTQPENLIIQGVEIGDERATLHYRLKSNRGFTAGLGIGPWYGFVQTNFTGGTLTIDMKNATVLEHRLYRSLLGEQSIETFGDYVQVGDGFAPRTMQIKSDSFDVRLKFQVHNNRLWLLHEAFRDQEQTPTIKIENVAVTLKD